MFCGFGFWIATDIGSRLALTGCRPLAALDGCRRMTSSTESLPSVLQKADSSWSGSWGRLVPARNTNSASASPLAQLSPPRALVQGGVAVLGSQAELASDRRLGVGAQPSDQTSRASSLARSARSLLCRAPEGAGCDFYESPAGEKELAAQ